MLARKLIAQVSLRTLFLATAIVAVATQATVAAMRHRIESRRAALIASFHAQLITSRSMALPIYSERFLEYVEQTVIAADVDLLSKQDKHRMLQSLGAERSQLHARRSAVPPYRAPSTSKAS